MVVNQRNSLEKGSFPTITVIDSIETSQNASSARRNCCGCIPERFGVFAILSVYLFFGLCGIVTSFGGLAFTSQTSDIIFLVISGFLNVFLTIISALGINAIKKEKAVMMYRLSITFWVFTVFTLIFSATLFILDIVYKSSLVKDCEDSLESLKASGESFDADCNHIANVYLVKEAIRLFFIETISMYFAYVIFKYANQMLRQAKNPTVLPVANRPPLTPTYFVYAAQPPTSNDWTPPPTYTVRPTNPLPDDLNTNSSQTSN